MKMFCGLTVGLLCTSCFEFDSTVKLSDAGSGPSARVGSSAGDGGSPAAQADDLRQQLVASGLSSEDAAKLATGGGVETSCSNDVPCRMGLECVDGACEASGETSLGDACLVSAECAGGQCVDSVCLVAGEGLLGESCRSASDCENGLRCGVIGIAAQCLDEGSADLGQTCEASNDCLAGLACKAEECLPIPGAPPISPGTWPGVDCEEPTDDVRAYFEVPGATAALEGDFFRLPFPNDVLTGDDGRVDISAFPTPGAGLLPGGDPVAPYVAAVDGSVGWGTNPTVTFRFSGPIDFDSLNTTGGIHWLDITDAENTAHPGISYRTFSGNTKYVCHDAVTVRRQDGAPLEPEHTYAVWVDRSTTAASGDSIERAENFVDLLKSAPPKETTLALAHAKYSKFREYLTAQKIDTSDVLVATVFTVGPVRNTMETLAQAVRAEPAPTISEWVLCADEDTPSPCPQASEQRACGGSSSLYEEYHALAQLPIFQKGEPPYTTADGEIVTTGAVRQEEVCLALTLPKSDAPESGWPLVLFAHGTGGSFRSHIRAEVAGLLSAAEAPDQLVKFAVLGIDQVQHGPRRGDSTESPNNLFFNFRNPSSAQGNPLQGAADILSVARLLDDLDVSAERSGGRAFRIDPDALVFFGHSQGATHGSLALPFAPAFKAAVLSGNGGSLMHAMLTKTSPVNIKAVVPAVLADFNGDGALPGGAHHPVLTLIQQHIDVADPLNFARQIAVAPIEGFPPRHVFQTYGQGDTFSPGLTMRMYAMAGGLQVVEPHRSVDTPEPLPAPHDEYPLTASFGWEEGEYTAGVREYAPASGEDGHFVAFTVADAQADIARFLAMAALGLVPQIGQ